MSVSLNPTSVRFDGNELKHVRRVRIEALPYDPNATAGMSSDPVPLPDVTEAQLSVIVERDITGDIEPFDLPGATGVLEFEVALGRSDAHRQKISADATLVIARLAFDREKGAYHESIYTAVSDGGNISSLIDIAPVSPPN